MTARKHAPAAFFIGQASHGATYGQGLINCCTGLATASTFRTNSGRYFQSYGIPLDPTTKVYSLFRGDV